MQRGFPCTGTNMKKIPDKYNRPLSSLTLPLEMSNLKINPQHLIMDKYEKQRQIFSIDAILMLLGVIALAVLIPKLLQESSTGMVPKAAVIATAVAAGIRVIILLFFVYGIRLSSQKRRINREVNIAAGIVLLILGLALMDGAFTFADRLVFVSIGMFVCVFCDFAIVGISVAALFILRPKQKKKK